MPTLKGSVREWRESNPEWQGNTSNCYLCAMPSSQEWPTSKSKNQVCITWGCHEILTLQLAKSKKHFSRNEAGLLRHCLAPQILSTSLQLWSLFCFQSSQLMSHRIQADSKTQRLSRHSRFEKFPFLRCSFSGNWKVKGSNLGNAYRDKKIGKEGRTSLGVAALGKKTLLEIILASKNIKKLLSRTASRT